ncbi:hypothetical protein [Micromonospora lupini]|uniref:hypothetical protein n=1 Tax=Micromonospora lupini TaxID=285679 RepID=UPI0034008912
MAAAERTPASPGRAQRRDVHERRDPGGLHGPGIDDSSHDHNLDKREVVAKSPGAKPLIASRTTVARWEQFDVISAGGGYVALRSRANGRYVTAESKGAKPLIASRTSISSWEKFDRISL